MNKVTPHLHSSVCSLYWLTMFWFVGNIDIANLFLASITTKLIERKKYFGVSENFYLWEWSCIFSNALIRIYLSTLAYTFFKKCLHSKLLTPNNGFFSLVIWGRAVAAQYHLGNKNKMLLTLSFNLPFQYSSHCSQDIQGPTWGQCKMF